MYARKVKSAPKGGRHNHLNNLKTIHFAQREKSKQHVYNIVREETEPESSELLT